MLASVDMNMIRLIDSKLFGLQATSLILSPATRHKLNMVTSISVLVENMVQSWVVVVLISQGSGDSTLRENLLMSMVISGFDLISATIGIIFSYELTSHDMATHPDLQLHLLSTGQVNGMLAPQKVLRITKTMKRYVPKTNCVQQLRVG